MDCIALGVAKSWSPLSNFHFHLLKKGKILLQVTERETLLEFPIKQRKQKCCSLLRESCLELRVERIDCFRNQICPRSEEEY